MTEAEWFACSSVEDMLKAIPSIKNSRKNRLFAVACCRQLLGFVPSLASKSRKYALEVAEQFADRLVSQTLLASMYNQLWTDWGDYRTRDGWEMHAYRAFLWAVHDTPSEAARMAAIDAYVTCYNHPRTRRTTLGDRVRQIQRETLRDIVGNPFRLVRVDPAWLKWHDGAVVQIAQAIYNARRFQDLPILADALEEAGCTDSEILGHCRRPEEHVRGCWPVDLVLGKS